MILDLSLPGETAEPCPLRTLQPLHRLLEGQEQHCGVGQRHQLHLSLLNWKVVGVIHLEGPQS